MCDSVWVCVYVGGVVDVVECGLSVCVCLIGLRALVAVRSMCLL